LSTARWSRVAIAGLACALACGCGYTLVGTGSVLPANLETLGVRPFANRTTRPEIDQRVTEEVSREFAKRGRLKVIADPAQADAVLDGAILDFRTRPVQFNDAGRASRVESTVMLQATLRVRATDEILWSQSQLVFREQYDVQDEGDITAQESLALDDIARGAAGTLVTSILEGF